MADDCPATDLPMVELIEEIGACFAGLAPQHHWGELTFFYNPGGQLRRGTYICTIKDKDGENDKASRLDREGVYRLNLSLPRPDYFHRFGPLPERPGKGGTIHGEWDFTALDRLTPHPVYGWMGWVSVLNPSRKTFEIVKPLLALSYEKAVAGFRKRTS